MNLRLLVMLGAVSLLGSSCSLVGGKPARETVNTAQQTRDVSIGSNDLAKANADRDLAVAEARQLFQAAQREGHDFSSGPCLANPLAAIPSWVADIAHSPRTTVDDVPENQCSAFRDGAATHFVELDPLGQLIRAQ